MKAGGSRTIAMMVVTMDLVFVGACCVITCPSPCSSHTSHYSQSRTVTLPGGPLARFDLAQVVNVDMGDDCPADDHPTGKISLSIANLTADTVSFDYTVTDYSQNGAAVWTYHGVVTGLAAGATIDVGMIATSTVPLIVNPGPG